ncbi:hypothetical protein GSI_12202 [Ganoderma sinense ZZ0214-1]|uniref:BTB domain-containing protein n=1 Tax=Ganoderma sinense ZZ0214-1 TaxID=1077348 RepID=A0A2G8RY78_9APHY|nr:hypothetical protein GSI_12202 [Ganoderma sinense ZZ0214-1]
MSQDPRPPKRQRTSLSGEDSSENSAVGLKRSEEFWIEDGNIVLIASGETAFRVYRGLLALQSTVFADLFASSSPSAEERYDECPVIRLTDSPQDLAHLLRALLPTSRASLYRSRGDPPLSIHQISAIVRLAHKYHVEDLLRQALSALKDTFTSSFKAFDEGFLDLPVNINTMAPLSIAVVNLARLTETLAVLPLALYTCCGHGPTVIDGWERDDGTTEYLSAADLKRCIGARETLAKEAFSLVSAIFNPKPSNDCATPAPCHTALRMTLMKVLETDNVAEPWVLDPWAPFIRDNGQPEHGAGYCYACQRELLERDIKERRRIWDRLPEIFDVEVPNWNEGPEPQGGQGGGENPDANGGQ